MKVRTASDNVRYVNYLEEAIDRVQQAIDSITYTAYPKVNQKTISKLEEALYTLEEAAEARLFKP